MSRKKVGLNLSSTRTQYIIVLIIVPMGAIAGYIIGRDQPVPLWIERHLIPGLGWFGLILIVIIVIDWLKGVLMPKKDKP